MGIYLNPDNINFQRALNSEIYVDKSEIIEYLNKILFTEQQFICTSRPRRFGKSMTANMLSAYYSKGCNSTEMFSPLKIAKHSDFEKHLNKYNVVHINMVDFINYNSTISEDLEKMCRRIIFEIKHEYSQVDCFDWNDINVVLSDVFSATKIPFVFIIDEWDCVFRIKKNDKETQRIYLDFLRKLLKDKSYVVLSYMTGILPIKKYGEHSALNMFTEISMTDPREYAEFTGFTEEEVRELCDRYNMPFEDTKKWYDGYNLRNTAIYNPRSVVMSMTGGYFNNYWTNTETYEALKVYIEMNMDGLKDAIITLLSGESVKIDATTFTNDMVTFSNRDDVLTLLIHLGYLTYNFDEKTVSIPNFEISEQFASTVRVIGWENVAKALTLSDELLKATLNCDEERVAELIDQSHSENTSILQYNDENSLSCVISIAYYSAVKNYVVYRELPTGKGYADLVFVPRKNCNTPAFIVELKYEKTAETALKQIKDRKYVDCLKDYSGDILLVGINYKKTDSNKNHTCKIEKVTKTD